MSYSLIMSAAQIARCNRALGSNQLSMQTITRTWRGTTSQQEVVVADAETIRRTIAALRDRPEACDDLPVERWDDATLEELNLSYLTDTLELVLADEEDPNMLHGVCL